MPHPLPVLAVVAAAPLLGLALLAATPAHGAAVPDLVAARLYPQALPHG